MTPFIIGIVAGTIWTIVITTFTAIQDCQERKEQRLEKANKDIS